MDEALKNEIELQVRRMFSQDADKHRQFLQQQMTELKWAAGVLATLLAAAIVYFAGKSYSDLQEYTQKQVDERVLTETVNGEIRKRVLDAIPVALTAPPATNVISTQLREQIRLGVEKEAADKLEKAVNEQLRVLNQSEIAKYLLPRGTIVAWFGKEAVPSGWAICDGTNGTPDLRQRFLRGGADTARSGVLGGNEVHAHQVTLAVSAGPSKGSDYRWGETPWRDVPNPALSGTYAANTPPQSNLPPYIEVVFIIKL